MSRGLLLLVVAVGLFALSMGVRSLVAQPPSRGTGLQAIKRPDLMVKWVSFEQSAGEVKASAIRVCVANVGAADAGGSTVGVYALRDVTGSAPTALLHSRTLTSVGAGHEAVVTFNGGGLAKTLFLVFADCPAAGKELGQIWEGHPVPLGTSRPVAEVNNGLLCAIDPAAGLPKTIYNPGACRGGF